MREIKFKIYNIAQFTQYKAQTYGFDEYVPYLRMFLGMYAHTFAHFTQLALNGGWQTTIDEEAMHCFCSCMRRFYCATEEYRNSRHTACR